MILNRCMQFDIFPNKLKIAKVLPVYKSGPTEHVTNNRPISFLTSISKIFERVINNVISNVSSGRKKSVPGWTNKLFGIHQQAVP